MVLGSHQGQSQKSINHSSRDGLLVALVAFDAAVIKGRHSFKQLI